MQASEAKQTRAFPVEYGVTVSNEGEGREVVQATFSGPEAQSLAEGFAAMVNGTETPPQSDLFKQ